MRDFIESRKAKDSDAQKGDDENSNTTEKGIHNRFDEAGHSRINALCERLEDPLHSECTHAWKRVEEICSGQSRFQALLGSACACAGSCISLISPSSPPSPPFYDVLGFIVVFFDTVRIRWNWMDSVSGNVLGDMCL